MYLNNVSKMSAISLMCIKQMLLLLYYVFEMQYPTLHLNTTFAKASLGLHDDYMMAPHKMY